MRPLTESEVTFSLVVLPEEDQIEGNCMASGDEEADRECAAHIYRELDRGNVWAWCFVQVIARWGSFEGFDSIGCCSYASEEDFKRDGYYQDMRATALADLNRRIQETASELERL